MPAIIDNQKKTLAGELEVALSENGKRLDSSVGYFNLRGWGKITDIVESLPDTPAVRLLIGMSSSPHNRVRAMLTASLLPENKQVEYKIQNDQFETEKQNIKQQLTWGIPNRDEVDSLQKLNDLLKQKKIKVRFYGHYPLHAKLYLCHRDISKSEIIAYIGSSNLTLAGLEGQGELNVEVSDIEMAQKLQHWFEERWQEAWELGITEFISETIDKSWAGTTQPDPYLVHLKLAYHLSQDARDGLAEYALPELLKDELLDFQAQAVKIAARNMMTRGGAMIGDVVGLGKTLMATGAAKILQEIHGHETLVICPKNLIEMWQAYMHKYELRGKVISIGETLNHLKKAPRHRTVIIDESHNFRTRGGKRWNAVRDYISRNEPKVLLLTATPFNLKMTDLGGQLGLFISEDEILEVIPNEAITKMGEAEFYKRCEDKPYSLKAFELSESVQDWQNLLSNYMIRRTRSFIEENYALEDTDANGNPTNKRYFKFANDDHKHYLPRRIPKPVNLKLLDGDPTGAMQADETVDEIESLNLPRFGWSNYVSENLKEDASKKEQSILDNSLANGKSLRGLTRTSLYKRLSSSSIAFQLSLQRHLIKNLVAKFCLEKGKPVPTSNYEFDLDPESNEMEQLSSDDDAEAEDTVATTSHEISIKAIHKKAEEILQNLASNKRVGYLSAELFQDSSLLNTKKDLLSHLSHDINVLEGMLERFDPVLAETDTKIQEIHRIISYEYPEEKFIIFTEYADTAHYLGQALEQYQIKGGIGTVTGSSQNPLEIARKFSPISSNAQIGPNEELRILVSTDVLSEGMNLQDSRIIINYDLPWAIIKLIQRAGRVDRIGQEAEKVIIYSLLPFEGVNKTIELHERLQKRLQQNAEVIGADEIILGHKGETSAYREFLEEAKLVDQDGFGVDYASQAYKIWNNAEEEYQDEVHQLSEPTISTLSLANFQSGNEGVLAFAKLSYQQGSTNIISFVTPDKVAQSLSPHEALRLTSCRPNTPPARLHLDFYQLLKVATLFGDSLNKQLEEGQVSGIRNRARVRLKECLDESESTLLSDPEKLRIIFDLLGKFPLQEAAKQSIHRSLLQSNKSLFTHDIIRLFEEDSLVINTHKENGNFQLICSMGLVK